MSTSVLEILINGKDNASGVLGGVNSALDGFRSNALAVGGALTAGVSAPALAVGGAALTMAGDYESAMSVLQAQTGASVGEMAALDALAIDLGADMSLPGTSARDAADAFLSLNQRGLTLNDTMGAARGVLQMSAAAQISNAEAATITASALNMFHLEGKEATRVADLLTAASIASGATVGDLGLGMQMAGAVASQYGLSIDQTATALAMMTREGIRGSDAGTSFKTMLMSLAAPTKQSAELMGALGIRIYDASGSMLPFPQIASQFSGALGGMTEQQRNAALATIFGTDAVRAANIVLMGGTEMGAGGAGGGGRGGAAGDMAGARMKGLNGALEGFRSTVETTLLTAAMPFLDMLADLVRRAADFVDGLGSLNPEILNAGIAFGTVLAVAGPVTLALGGIATVLGALLSPIGLVVLAVGALAAAWALNLGGIREIVGGVMDRISEFIGKIGETVGYLQRGELLMAIRTMFGPEAVAPVGGFVLSVMGHVREFVGKIQEAIGFLQRGEWLMAIRTIFGPEAVQPVGNFVASMQTAWNTIVSTVQTAIGIVWNIVQLVLSNVATFLQNHGAEIKATIFAAWEAIGNVVKTVVAIVQAVVIPALQGVADFIRTHGDDIQRVLSAAWIAVQGVIQGALTLIQGVVKAVLQAVQGDWSGAWETLKTTGETLWNGIKDTVSRIAETLGPTLSKIWEGIKSKAEEIWNGIKAKAEEIWSSVKSAAEQKWEEVKEAIKQKIVEAFQAVVKWLDDTLVKIEGFSLKEAARAFFMTTLPGIIEGIGKAIEEVGKWLKDTFDKIKLHDLKPATQTSFATVISGIIDGARDALLEVGQFLAKAADVIRGMTFRSETLQMIKTVAVAILDGAVEAVKSTFELLGKVKDALASGDLSGVGSALIDGFMGGIRSKAESVAQAAREIVQKAVQAAKDALNMHSPSKVFMDIGEGIPLGMAMGIEGAMQLPIDAMKGIIESLKDLAEYFADPTRGLGSAKAVTDPLADVFKNLQEIFNGLAALGDAELAPALARIRETLGSVMDGLEGAVHDVIARLKGLAEWAADPDVGMGSAKAVTDPLAEIFKNLGEIVAGINALAEADLAKWQTAEGKTGILAAVVVAVGTALGQAAKRIDADLLAGAQAFATAIQPVLSVIEPGVKALEALIEMPDAMAWMMHGQHRSAAWMLTEMVDVVARQFATARDRLGDLLSAAQAFGGPANAVMEAAGKIAEAIKKLFEMPDLMEWLSYGQDQTVAFTLTQVVETLASAFSDARGRLDVAGARQFASDALELLSLTQEAFVALTELSNAGLDNAALTEIGFGAGRSWITALADGIRSGLDYLQAALAAVAGLFPGVVGAGEGAGQGLAAGGPVGFGAGGLGAGGQAGSVTTVNLSINNPVVRDEVDIQRLADEIGAVLAGQAGTRRRLNVGWA